MKKKTKNNHQQNETLIHSLTTTIHSFKECYKNDWMDTTQSHKIKWTDKMYSECINAIPFQLVSDRFLNK